MGHPTQDQGTVACQAVSKWDEPCDLPAAHQCDKCSVWFCAEHFPDPEWHPCAED